MLTVFLTIKKMAKNGIITNILNKFKFTFSIKRISKGHFSVQLNIDATKDIDEQIHGLKDLMVAHMVEMEGVKA